MKPTDLATERRAHQAALTGFLAAARALPPDRWNQPAKPGGWSPGQIAEHLRLSYQTLGGELEGGQGLRLRTNWWQRLLLRFKFLGAILEEGQIPPGARAPRELMPGEGPFDREAVLASLEAVASRAESAVAARWTQPGASATHHIFGRLAPSQVIRFSTVHVAHHTKQLIPVR